MDWVYILGSLATAGGAIFSGFKAFSTIKEAEKGVRTTWGKAQRNKVTGEVVVHDPGGKWMWPFAQKMDTLRTKGNFVSYDNLSITLKNNLTYKFNAFITYDVIEEPHWIEHILYKLEDRDLFVGNHFMRAIQNVLHRSEELDVKNASARLKKAMEPILSANGWVVQDCEIMMFTETPVSQFLRGVDYRIQKAIEYKDILPVSLLCSALGVNSVVTVEEEEKEFTITNEETPIG